MAVGGDAFNARAEMFRGTVRCVRDRTALADRNPKPSRDAAWRRRGEDPRLAQATMLMNR
jgi:hypothetical protein